MTQLHIEMRNAIAAKQNHRCCYCGHPLRSGRPKGMPRNQYRIDTLEHILPTSRGGDYSEGNLAVACYQCNQEKANMTVREWIITKLMEKAMFL